MLKRKQKPKIKGIDGYRNFLFLSPHGYPMQESSYKSVLNGVIKKYNKSHEKTPLPRITPHSLRHTFCTQLAQKNMNPKNLHIPAKKCIFIIDDGPFLCNCRSGDRAEVSLHPPWLSYSSGLRHGQGNSYLFSYTNSVQILAAFSIAFSIFGRKYFSNALS